MTNSRRPSVCAAVAAFFAVLVGVAMAMPMPPDPDGLRDMCTDAMRAITDDTELAIVAIENETESALESLDGTGAPASAFYKIVLTGVTRIEKEQAKGLKAMNKEADKCIAKLTRIQASAGRAEFVETVRTESRNQIGDTGFGSLEGINDTITTLLFEL